MPMNARAASSGSIVPEGALINPGLNVSGEIIVKHAVLFAEKHVRQFVAFQRAEEQQSKHRGVGAGANAVAGDERKDTVVVTFARHVLDGARAVR